MAKRKLEELNLLDNFLFGSMVTHPKLGERFVIELLQIIFNRQFGRLIVVPQKVYYGTDTDIHGARLDVYLEESLSDTNIENSIVYDLEPDKNSDITVSHGDRFIDSRIILFRGCGAMITT